MDLQEQYAGGTSWQLTADQGAVFDRERRTTLRNIRVRVQDRERMWTIVGEEGTTSRTRGTWSFAATSC